MNKRCVDVDGSTVWRNISHAIGMIRSLLGCIFIVTAVSCAAPQKSDWSDTETIKHDAAALVDRLRDLVAAELVSDRVKAGQALGIKIINGHRYADTVHFDWQVVGWLAAPQSDVAYDENTGVYNPPIHGLRVEKARLSLSFTSAKCVSMNTVRQSFSGGGWTFRTGDVKIYSSTEQSHPTTPQTCAAEVPGLRFATGELEGIGEITYFFSGGPESCAYGANLVQYF